MCVSYSHTIENIDREMANVSIGLICILLAVFVPAIDGRLMNGVNGGAECAGCTMVLGIIERVSIIYNESIVSALERFCNFLPNEFRTYCKVAVDFLGKSDGCNSVERERKVLLQVRLLLMVFQRKKRPMSFVIHLKFVELILANPNADYINPVRHHHLLLLHKVERFFVKIILRFFLYLRQKFALFQVLQRFVKLLRELSRVVYLPLISMVIDSVLNQHSVVPHGGAKIAMIFHRIFDQAHVQ